MTYSISLTPRGRWQVVRSDGMIMAVLSTWSLADEYVKEKRR